MLYTLDWRSTGLKPYGTNVRLIAANDELAACREYAAILSVDLRRSIEIITDLIDGRFFFVNRSLADLGCSMYNERILRTNARSTLEESITAYRAGEISGIFGVYEILVNRA